LALIGDWRHCLITRPLNKLIRSVQAFEKGKLNGPASPANEASVAADDRPVVVRIRAHGRASRRADDGAKHQDELRRELVANVSMTCARRSPPCTAT
jgi:hypothetical protein